VLRSVRAGSVIFRGFWLKFDLEMKVEVKYWTWIFLHVLHWSIMRNMSFTVTTFFKLLTFWILNQHHDHGVTLKFRSNMNIFFISFDMISYTVSILFFCSKTNDKEVIQHWNCDFSYLRTLGSIIGKISVTGICLEQTWESCSIWTTI
jgi:hypothetical protein